MPEVGKPRHHSSHLSTFPQLHPGWALDDVVACEDKLLGTPIPVTYGFGETINESDDK